MRLLGAHVVQRVLSELVAGARDGAQPSSGCSLRPGDAFDCDELGIYEEDEWPG